MISRGAHRLGVSLTLMALVVLMVARSRAADEPAESTCVKCHLLLPDNFKAPAEVFKDDIHNQSRLGCVGCHGGDPKGEQPQDAMDPAKGFRGAPKAPQIPDLCGGCHQNAAFVKQFAPNLPTDQLAQYWTSVHGQRIKAGDKNVATCASCHGAHGILSVHDTRSPVYPTHIVDTCASCHADAQRMAPYKIPTDQVAEYKQSVHYRALTVTNDLSAPTCNGCHGAHGATPPGVESIANVCGTCHSRNMELFRSSPHQQAFANLSAGACEACHSNHRVLSPKDSWLKVEDDGVCARCHTREDRGGAAAIGMLAALQLAVRTTDEAKEQVTRAERAGMLMEDADAALQHAHEEIVTARTEVHTASVAAVAEHTDAAIQAGDRALASAHAAFEEIRYRRTGLLVALAFIVLAIVALELMIRKIEHPPAPPRKGARRPEP
ncbi:MAG: cytochrome c3 family protein [Candidatus Binatia bacterium]